MLLQQRIPMSELLLAAKPRPAATKPHCLCHTSLCHAVCATLSVIDALLYHISSRPTTSIQIFHRDKTQTQCYIRRASHPTASIQICIYPPTSQRSPIAVSTFSQKINLQIVNWRFFADPSQVSQVFVSDVI